MTFNLDVATILQGVAVAILVGVGKTVWSSAIALAKLNTKLDEHTAQDAKNFELLHDDIRDLREKI